MMPQFCLEIIFAFCCNPSISKKGEVYIIGFKKGLAVTMTAGMMLTFVPATVMADSAGWKGNDADGWYYYTSDDEYVKGWKQINGKWYFFDYRTGKMFANKKSDLYASVVDGIRYWFKESGEMITGWYYDGENWHYAGSDGALYSDQWLSSGGKWYYFVEEGFMLRNVKNFTIDEVDYSFDSDGVCLNPDAKSDKITGWYGKEAGNYTSWYYYDENGEVCKGWKSISGNWYYFSEEEGYMYSCDSYSRHIDGNFYWFKKSGEMITGWYNDGTNWHYARPNGVLYCNEWLSSGGKWYYFDYNQNMIANAKNYEIDGKDYSFDSNGVCLNPDVTASTITGWYKRFNAYPYYDNYDEYMWYYYDENGVAVTGWKQIDGKLYFFEEDGRMATGFANDNGTLYYFDENGQIVTEWFKTSYDGKDYWHYAESNGKVVSEKWISSSRKWYYINSNGNMVTNIDYYLINGIYYSFDANGVCRNPDSTKDKITGWCYIPMSDDDPCYYWFYFDEDGNMYHDQWLNYCGKWYYFCSQGMMEMDFSYINGRLYEFDKNGVCLNPYNGKIIYLA